MAMPSPIANKPMWRMWDRAVVHITSVIFLPVAPIEKSMPTSYYLVKLFILHFLWRQSDKDAFCPNRHCEWTTHHEGAKARVERCHISRLAMAHHWQAVLIICQCRLMYHWWHDHQPSTVKAMRSGRSCKGKSMRVSCDTGFACFPCAPQVDQNLLDLKDALRRVRWSEPPTKMKGRTLLIYKQIYTVFGYAAYFDLCFILKRGENIFQEFLKYESVWHATLIVRFNFVLKTVQRCENILKYKYYDAGSK